MKLIPPRGQRAVPAFSGLLLVMAFPPFRLALVSFIALTPLLFFIGQREGGPEGRWEATRGAMLAGLVYFGLTLYWLVIALIFYSLLAIPAYIGTVLVLVCFSGAFGWALHYVIHRTPVPLAVAAAALWTALEWVQGHLSHLSFPWLGLGTSLAEWPVLAGAADLVGARGLTVWLAAVSGLAAQALLRRRAGKRLRPAVGLLAAAVVLVPILYGVWRDRTLELRPAARVAVVQPNIPEDMKMDARIAADTSLSALTALTLRVPRDSVDLVAWPEVAVPRLLDPPNRTQLSVYLQRLAGLVGAPILTGAYGVAYDEGDSTFFNSAFIVTADSVARQRYDKIYLVPFVERIPFVDPDWFEGLFGDIRWFGGLGRGTSSQPMALNDATFGVLICYESIFAQLSREYRSRGADFLVNMTNDAWYGREEWYARTSALWQHPSHLVLRAIENRVGVARPANTGISMFVDPRGRPSDWTELFEPDIRIATVYTTDAETLFTRWGDWLATGTTLVALLLLVAARFRPIKPA